MKTSISEQFLKQWPAEFTQKILKGCHFAYQSSWRQSEALFALPEATNVNPFLRRAYLEQTMREIAGNHPEIEVTTNRSNWWYHVKLSCGISILTESAASHPDEVIKATPHRQVYAEQNQLLLFESNVKPKEKMTIYGILLHGKHETIPEKLGFAVIRFPLKDCSGYYFEQIDLMKLHPDATAKPKSKPAQEIAAPTFKIKKLDDKERLG